MASWPRPARARRPPWAERDRLSFQPRIRRQHGLVRAHGCRRAVRDLAAPRHHDEPAGDAENRFHVVVDDDECAAGLMELLNALDQLVSEARMDAGERLVE